MPLSRCNGPGDLTWEALVQSFPRLGSVNAALVALYFAPVWGADALRALTSPFYGFEDRVPNSSLR
jgi:tetrahydromethanopterin S-methyltransferase subunit C